MFLPRLVYFKSNTVSKKKMKQTKNYIKVKKKRLISQVHSFCFYWVFTTQSTERNVRCRCVCVHSVFGISYRDIFFLYLFGHVRRKESCDIYSPLGGMSTHLADSVFISRWLTWYLSDAPFQPHTQQQAVTMAKSTYQAGLGKCLLHNSTVIHPQHLCALCIYPVAISWSFHYIQCTQ